MVKERGVSEVLRQVRDIGKPAVQEMIEQMGPAIALPLIRENALPIVHELVNYTFIAQIIDSFVTGVELQMQYYVLVTAFIWTWDQSTSPLASDSVAFNRANFFNAVNYYRVIAGRAGLGFPMTDPFYVLYLHGISFVNGTALGFSTLAQDRILNGYNTANPDSPDYVPGWLQDTDSGSGVADFLSLYDDALADPGLRPALQTKYDCTWFQLQNLNRYLRDYVEATTIPAVIAGTTITVSIINWGLLNEYIDILGTLMPELAGYTSTAQIAEKVFYELWADGTALGSVLYPGGMDFGDFLDDVPPGATGFEPCIPGTNTTGLTLAQSLALWNDASNYSLTNLDGIAVWYEVYEGSVAKSVLTTRFSITLRQVNMILDWLWGSWNISTSGRFAYHLLPLLLNTSLGYGVPIDVLSEQIIYEQWANATVLGMALYPAGLDINDIANDSFGSPVFGLEAGVPAPVNLSMSQCYALWNASNEQSLLHMGKGIADWHAAVGNAAKKSDLMAAFGLSTGQMDILLSWLWDDDGFSDYLVPLMIESPLGYNMPLAQFCLELLYSQWANGTILGEVLFPYPGFPLPLKGGIVYGFEVGVPVSTNMTVESAYCLWNTSSSYSLVTPAGIATWTKAVEGDAAAKSTLKVKNGLTDHAMNRLVIWLPLFQHNVMPYLAQESMDLPTDSITLANYVLYFGMLLGAVIMLFGIIVVARRVKKRKAWRPTWDITKTEVPMEKAMPKDASSQAPVPAASSTVPLPPLASIAAAPVYANPSRPVKPVTGSVASKPTRPTSPPPQAIPSVKTPPPAPPAPSAPPAPPAPSALPARLPSLPPATPAQQPSREFPTVPRPVFEEHQQFTPVKEDVPIASPLASFNQSPVEKPSLEKARPVEKLSQDKVQHVDRVEEPRTPSGSKLTTIGTHQGSNPAIGNLAAIGERLDKFESGAMCSDALKEIVLKLETLEKFGKIKTDLSIWLGQLAREPWDATTKKMMQKRIKNWVDKLEG